MKMLQNCDQFEVSHVYLYFKEADAEFWSTLLVLLKKFPVKTLQMSGKALLGVRMEELREIWEFCVLERLQIDSKEVQVGDQEGWEKIQEIVAKVANDYKSYGININTKKLLGGGYERHDCRHFGKISESYQRWSGGMDSKKLVNLI